MKKTANESALRQESHTLPWRTQVPSDRGPGRTFSDDVHWSVQETLLGPYFVLSQLFDCIYISTEKEKITEILM